jgi:regulator of protease activity HflC (stomatin/prohibitin superfamily)
MAILGVIAGISVLAVIAIGVIPFLLLISLRIIFEYERGIVFTLGKYIKRTGTRKPGLRIVIPIIQRMVRVDMRLRVVDVPEQDTITKDNVSVRVNAVIYYKVSNAEDSVIKVENANYAISQLAQTTMRNVVGEITLDQLLSQRDRVSDKIQLIVDKASDPWGIKVESVELKHVELPGDMKRVMAKAAEAERIKRATIIRSEGESLASMTVAKAAFIIGKQHGALQLRTLQSLNDIASDPSNTVHFFVPFDVMKPYEGYKER